MLALQDNHALIETSALPVGRCAVRSLTSGAAAAEADGSGVSDIEGDGGCVSEKNINEEVASDEEVALGDCDALPGEASANEECNGEALVDVVCSGEALMAVDSVFAADCVSVIVAHDVEEPVADTIFTAVAEVVKKDEDDAESVETPEAVAIAEAEGDPEPSAEPDAECVPMHRASVAASL